MKRGFIGLFAGVIASLGVVAHAGESNAYIGVNYMIIEQDSRFVPGDTIDTGETVVRFGGEINEYFSSELRVGMTTASVKDGAAELKNLYSIGGLLRVRKEYGSLTPYLGLGYMWTREELSGAGPLSGEATVADVAAAVGVDISLGENLGLNLEYFALTMKPISDINRTGPSAGVFWRF
ncbi:outer membrane beta-barrel protein [Alcanivorax sp. 1008]|uniref:outer membrane beta-barrel protein n=1 Tax=Alcanivorax sp. 1008 TaxID=2816853 RepID=UPI001D61BDEA|nr:outer membrane beta-barrel protein [Alcanivorax sp. 1008]MCC1496916.1 outer membrane beta-barrel protein [Alcanivorax sp. 1008]